MKHQNGNLGRALYKAKNHYQDTWCGYFTPSEIVELWAVGIECYEYDVHRAMKKKKAGECRSTWFYFTPKAKLRELLQKYHEEKLDTSRKKRV